MQLNDTKAITVADILLFRGIPISYSYLVPEFLKDKLKPGVHVIVPLGNSRCKGLILSVTEEQNAVLNKKAILDTESTIANITEEQVFLIQRFASYYQCVPYKAYQCIIGNRKYRPENSTVFQDASDSPYTLNDEQQQAFDGIISVSGYSEHLLHGITGSGKTEIYMHLAAEMLRRGKTIVVLCPEISLTPQYTRHFTQRFGNKITVLHSNLTPKQRDLAWSAIQDGHVSIIIGPRSAVFSPNLNLGMIIIDEEHDASYKQDSHPRYHTHRVARWRCQYNNCQLVLGSATPSITSYALSKALVPESDLTVKRYYYQLTKRATGSNLPSVEILDSSIEEPSRFPSLSQSLVDAISERLEKKEKVLILLNRRGFAPYIVCQRCKQIHSCASCDLSYTYHQDKTFRCHRCDIILPFTHMCQKCQKPGLAFQGTGIQKIETACKDLFQDAHILRLDKDTAKTAKQMEAILNEFKEKGDILIGTQLISKGHHIEDITFVGVCGIDTTLNLPDYTSSEQAFQLLMQVSGRAGRGAKKGHVMIQTLQNNHYAIESALSQNYDNFIQQELEFREQLNYPPFCTLTNIILSCTDKAILMTYCKSLKNFLDSQKIDGLQLLGPKPAPFEKVRLHWRFHVLIKHSDKQNELVQALIDAFPKASASIRIILDKDPLQLL